MAGSKNLFIRVSPSLFKKETGCSVWLSCFLTRAVVYVLDPVAVVFSMIAAVYWIGMPGVLLAVPSLFLWGVCKMCFSNWLPAGWVVLLMSLGVGVSGALVFDNLWATAYFCTLAAIIFQNYLLFAVPLADAIKCAWSSKRAFEIFYETSKNTVSPVLTILEINEYVDIQTKEKVSRN